LKNLGFA
jgi:hypothetical protein